MEWERRGVAWRGLAQKQAKVKQKVATCRNLGARRGGSLNLPGDFLLARATLGTVGAHGCDALSNLQHPPSKNT